MNHDSQKKTVRTLAPDAPLVKPAIWHVMLSLFYFLLFIFPIQVREWHVTCCSFGENLKVINGQCFQSSTEEFCRFYHFIVSLWWRLITYMLYPAFTFVCVYLSHHFLEHHNCFSHDVFCAVRYFHRLIVVDVTYLTANTNDQCSRTMQKYANIPSCENDIDILTWTKALCFALKKMFYCCKNLTRIN